MSRHSRITAGNDYTYWAEECRSIKRSNDYWLTTAHPLFCTTPAGGGRSYLTTVNQITGWPPRRHCTVQYYLPFSNWLRMSLAGIRGKPRINDTAPKNKFFSPNNQWNKKIPGMDLYFSSRFESVKILQHLIIYINLLFP